LSYFIAVNLIHLRSPHHVKQLPHPDRELRYPEGQ
jgi:hypothetical protein